MHLQTRD